MKVSLNKVRRDYLALIGESPGLSPILGEGEDSAVLTLEEELSVRLIPAAIKATLECDPVHLDEIAECSPAIEWGDGGSARLRLPEDYLRLHTLRMYGWKDSVTRVEPPGTLRDSLRGRAPAWMNCPDNPLVVEERDAAGPFLRVYGCPKATERPEQLLYVPEPCIVGDDLKISKAAYRRMLELLIQAA